MERCPTRTVDDAPAAEDAFGSHEPIVDAIHEIITTEPGGRTVGIEGGWGSGKSTVVKLLAARVTGRDSHMVVFDTWAHEGDPLRRSFLEELIGSLISKRWVDAATWRKRREELAKRRRVESIRPVAKLEKPAIIIAAAAVVFALLVPLGTTLIGAGLATAPVSAGMVRAGAAIYVALLVVVAVAVGLSLAGRLGGTRGAWLSFFSVQSVTESDRETIETPDPTSIEFESTFKDLMRSALGTDPRRRLVLVVDNLDRVAPDDARSIWATLQTFLHHSHDAPEPWLNSLWVLLPYDRSGIARLWDRSHGAHTAGEEPGTPLAESFIEKSVQVRFEVPLPLITDWREYLDSILRVVVASHETEFYVAYRLYAHQLADDARAPTPRELKQYANRIGALHRRWQHMLPFSSLAYYASLNLSSDKVARGLRNGSLPERGLSGLLSADAEGDLAALAFNTTPARARQLLLGPLIVRALTRETSDELTELVDRTGFWEALLQSYFLKRPAQLEDLLRTANHLRKIPKERRAEAEWREVRSLLSEHGQSFPAWPTLTGGSAEDLCGVLSLIDPDAAAAIAERATAAPVQPQQGADWADGAHVLLGQFDFLRELRVSGSPEAVLEVVTRFGSIRGARSLARRLAIDPTDRNALDQLIVGRIADAPDEALGGLTVLAARDPDIEWEPFASTAAQHLKTAAASQSPRRGFQIDAGRSLNLLGIVRLDGATASKARVSLVSDGVALEYVALADQEGHDEALGGWLYEHLRQRPSDLHPDARARSPSAARARSVIAEILGDPRHRAVSALARAAESHSSFDFIASIGASAEGRKLADALVAALWESERFAGAMTGDRFRTFWPHISRASTPGNRNLADFIGLVGRHSELADELASGAFPTDRMGMYAAVIASHADRHEAARVASWVVTSLGTLDVEDWSTAMDGSDDWVDLLRAIRDVDDDAQIGGTFAQALGRFVARAADGMEVEGSVSARWESTVLPSIAPSIRGAYAEGVVTAAARVRGGLPVAFFDLAGGTLGNPEILRRTEIRNSVLPDLVVKQNEPGLAWLIKTLSDRDSRRNAPGEYAALAEVVRASLEQTTDVRQHFLELARLIGVEVAPKETEPSEVED